MSWTVTPQLKTLAGTAGAIPQESILGLPIDGGFFAGYISHTADGNPTHALIVAPKAAGATGTGYTLTTNLIWKTTSTATTGTQSTFDGAANTVDIVTSSSVSHPAAEFCVNLNIGGFTDWYLPARYELDIAYFNLKPNTTANSTSSGVNNYSVPKRTANNTISNPGQTSVTAFRDTGSEAFIDSNHWSSTQGLATNAWIVNFGTGSNISTNKANVQCVRAFRRIAL